MQNTDFQTITNSDIPRIVAMEEASHLHPWTEGIFRDCLRVAYDCWKMVQGNDIIGFCILSFAVDECHILNLVVDPAYQGKGYGDKLLSFILSKAKEKSVQSLFLEVRASNLRAQNLYKKHGFNEISVRKNYYPAHEGREDAIILGFEL